MSESQSSEFENNGNNESLTSAPRTPWEKCIHKIARLLLGPVEHVRTNYVLPNQKQSAWYHQKFRRVPSIDECEQDDQACFFEANCQYRRDRSVDTEILSILRQRFEDCVMYEKPDEAEKCTPLLNTYDEATTNWFTKYGDLGGNHNVLKCYMKQKHRMLWENKYGEVGTGMNEKEEKGGEGETKAAKNPDCP